MSDTTDIVARLRELCGGIMSPLDPNGTAAVREAADRISALEAEVVRLEKERVYAVHWGNTALESVKSIMWRYEEALEPFARAARSIDVDPPGDHEPSHGRGSVTAGDLRRARAALEGQS